MHKISPFLWFDNNAEEAMNFYVSIFKDSKVVNVHGAERRPRLQVHGGSFIRCQLRDSGGSRPLLDKTQ